MRPWCRYRNALGEPGVGFHARRLAGVALWDVVGTLVIAALLARWTSWSYARALASLFLLGVALHWLFCVPTALNRALGLA
jgi:hypothetical protein